MKKATLIVLVVIFTFISCLGINTYFKHNFAVNNEAKSNRINLVIDAGHGGIDAGTIGVDNANEKDINLGIALKLYDFIRISGINASLIRSGDYQFYKKGDNTKRSDLYNRMQIWYSPNDNKSPILADSILNVTKEFLQPDNKRLNKKSDSSYYLLHKAKVPSVMVECGFMSNREENKKLQDEKYQNKLAYLIMLGLNIYITEEL